MEKYKVTVNGLPYEVEIEPLGSESSVSNAVPVARTQQVQLTQSQNPQVAKAPSQSAKAPVQAAVNQSNGASETIFSPMQGKIVGVKVAVGQMLKRGDVIAVLEAMKMENEIMAPRDAKVLEVHVEIGKSVEANDILAILV